MTAFFSRPVNFRALSTSRNFFRGLIILTSFAWLALIPATSLAISGLVLGPALEKQPQPGDPHAAVAAISGSPWPGVIDHLLQRPLPDSNETGNIASIHINYPSIGNKTVDSDIRAWATEIADAFESHLDSTTSLAVDEDIDSKITEFLQDDDLNSEYAFRSLPRESAFELFGNYTVSRPSNGALSITFELWNYTGNPRGNLDIITLNYNLLNNRRLSFVDIFENPQLALELMSSWSRKKLSPRLDAVGCGQMLHDGTMPLVENFSSLTLTPEGISINFQPYQVAPWEAGIQKVDIPLEELMPSAPLLALWGK